MLKEYGAENTLGGAENMSGGPDPITAFFILVSITLQVLRRNGAEAAAFLREEQQRQLTKINTLIEDIITKSELSAAKACPLLGRLLEETIWAESLDRINKPLDKLFSDFLQPSSFEDSNTEYMKSFEDSNTEYIKKKVHPIAECFACSFGELFFIELLRPPSFEDSNIAYIKRVYNDPEFNSEIMRYKILPNCWEYSEDKVGTPEEEQGLLREKKSELTRLKVPANFSSPFFDQAYLIVLGNCLGRALGDKVTDFEVLRYKLLRKFSVSMDKTYQTENELLDCLKDSLAYKRAGLKVEIKLQRKIKSYQLQLDRTRCRHKHEGFEYFDNRLENLVPYPLHHIRFSTIIKPYHYSISTKRSLISNMLAASVCPSLGLLYLMTFLSLRH